MEQKISLIAAVSSRGVIGSKKTNDLPWRLPLDFAHFKKATAGSAVLMGSRCWESLPAKSRPLPGRRNCVLSRTKQTESGAECFQNKEQALAALAHEKNIFVIGGGEIYKLFLQDAHELLLTEVDDSENPVDGDVFFPEFKKSDFHREVVAQHEKDAQHDFPFSIVRYRRKG